MWKRTPSKSATTTLIESGLFLILRRKKIISVKKMIYNDKLNNILKINFFLIKQNENK